MKKLPLRKIYKICKFTLFPAVLFLLPFIKIRMGVDIADTAYSLGNYRDFGTERNVWSLLTFIPGALGHLFTMLPYGNTMLGMKIYSTLVISLMALVGYRFFMTKMPGWLAFLSQFIAIGMCWAPAVVLYHYMTYFLLLLASIFLFRGLAGTNRSYCLFIAGIILGINTFVKFPGNGLQVLLIFALWFYALITEKEFSEVFKQTMLCIAGYAVAFGAVLLVITATFGSDSFGMMINGVFGIAGSASDYTFGQMIASTFDAYLHGFKWAIYMILCILPGIPFFVLWPGKMIPLRKFVYCACIAFLFFVLGRWGMYNFRFYQKESALQWGAIFLLISIGIDIWMIFTKQLNNDWKLIGIISLINILVLPLGSNNHIWPALNDLFFIAPVTVWMVYKFVRWGRSYLDETGKVPLFALKSMSAAVVIAFFIMACGLGVFYVFMDGEEGSPRTYAVSDNEVLKGMRTTDYNARNLSELSAFMKKTPDNAIITYGNIPGAAYFLGRKNAISTLWADLDSYPDDTFRTELADIKTAILTKGEKAPMVIKSLYPWQNQDANPVKEEALFGFMNELGYESIFENEGFEVFALTNDNTD
ncbi:MAG: hypothetical protein K5888_05920 [Lachnospiraceae bacterium]|nr:hypothetical protein [Lachnospiraceae bacterium]